MKWDTGDKAGESIYTAVNVIDLALNIPHMVKRLVKGGKSIINSGSSIENFFKKGPMIIGDFKDGASKYIDELVDGIGNIVSPKREYAGIGQISEKNFNNLSKVDIKPITKNDIQNNYNRVVNEGKGIEIGLKSSLNNIGDFISGNKNFEDVISDYAKIYSDNINSNANWSWNKSIPGGGNLSIKQKRLIKELAMKNSYIPDIKVNRVDGMKFGFADFESAAKSKKMFACQKTCGNYRMQSSLNI